MHRNLSPYSLLTAGLFVAGCSGRTRRRRGQGATDPRQGGELDRVEGEPFDETDPPEVG